jgi:DNA-binding NarL/FixJ family response regulator
MTVRRAPPPDRPARILVVDDEPLNVDYLEQELESHGFVTETAANGVEALARIAAAPPDLVLLDVMMPELDGIAALRILKNDPDTNLIPVVLMTALNAVDDRVRGIEAGADDFLSKPVDDRELLARIRTALELRRTIDATVAELRGRRVSERPVGASDNGARGPDAGYPAGLTAREVEVLRLVAVGLSDAETAERLVLSVRTVNAHLRSIYRKLGVRSRVAAGRFAEEHGLL